MVATDVAARGIDISHLTHVINFGFPESAEQYVHRTGRTGRAGRTGTAISVLGPGNLGALYYLRLTFKIFPIERSLPSATELKTRLETDRMSLLLEAFKDSPLDEHLELVRRLQTHPEAERVLSGLVRSFFSTLSGDLDESAAAARRERNDVIAPAIEPSPGASMPETRLEPEAQAAQGTRKRRRRGRGREGQESRLDQDSSEDDEPAAAAAPALVEEPIQVVRASSAASVPLREAPPRIAPVELGEIPEARPELPDMTTLYLNVGKRDGLEAQDLTALLSSSCELGSEDIGRVRVKDRHTFVGVPTERVDSVISSLAGQTIKNRELHVERART